MSILEYEEEVLTVVNSYSIRAYGGMRLDNDLTESCEPMIEYLRKLFPGGRVPIRCLTSYALNFGTPGDRVYVLSRDIVLAKQALASGINIDEKYRHHSLINTARGRRSEITALDVLEVRLTNSLDFRRMTEEEVSKSMELRDFLKSQNITYSGTRNVFKITP